jgi:rare lipoprotein A
MSKVFLGIVALLLTAASAQARHAGAGERLSPGFADRSAHAHARHHARRDVGSAHGGDFIALASWYGDGPKIYEPNSHTANGERFNKWDLTAAHRSLPFGTRLRVTHAGHSVVVRINDRGPALWTGRSLDLSKGAAVQLGMISVGAARVNYSIVGH